MATVTTSIGTALGSAGDGVVTLTSGSTSVTGQGTFFTTSFTGGTAPPQAIEIPIGGGTYYTVKSVESNTELTLVSDPGVSASMQSWKVGTRDYSSVAAWEADLDNTNIYSSGDTAKGECYDDSDFSITGSITVDGGGTVGLDAVILSVAAGQRHDGTAKEVGGSGVRFLFSGAYVFYINEARDAWVEWIDFDANDQEIRNAGVIYLQGGSWYTQHENGAVWCIVHDNIGQNSVGGNDHTMGIRGLGAGKFICNCIVYNMSNRGTEDCYGIYTNDQDRTIVTNCTVYNIHGFDTTPALSDAIGVQTSATANAQYRNNISARVYGSANNLCFANSAGGDNNNLSTDDTADGTNCIADVDYTTLFHSTTAGAEDLHILRSSQAVGAGEDLGTQRTIGGYTVPPVAGLMNRDINHGDRNSRAMTWDIGASQNAIVSTIGTTGREYSTVAAWTADLDEDTYYGAGSVARGECYADTAFTACHLENGDTIGLVHAVLTAADGQQHDGTAGTGVVFNMAGIVNSTSPVYCILSFLEFTQSSTFGEHDAVNARNPSGMQVSHCLIHGYDLRHSTSSHIALLRVSGGSNGYSRATHNNILYDLTRGIVGNKTQTLHGIKQDNAYATITNNTVYNIHADSTDGTYTQNASGIYYERVTTRVKNNIVMGLSSANGTTTGMTCEDGSPNHANNNMVNDTSETGGSSQTGKSSSGQFVSTTTGSEDFHLVVGSDAIGNGADLGLFTDATGFAPYPGNYAGRSRYVWGQNYDINRGNRHAFSMAWDIGASQYEIIAKIGTTSRDFSTIAAWEAQLDNTDYYGKGSRAKGECYKDSDFQITGALTIDGGGTVGLDTRTITAAVGQRHDGTANTGVRLLLSADSGTNFLVMDSSVGSTSTGNQIEWLEIDANEKNVMTLVSISTYGGAQNNLAHGGRWSGGNQFTIGIGSGAKQCWICNNIVYDLYLDNGSSAAEGIYGIYQGHIDWVACVNNTVYNVRSNSSASADVCVGIWVKNGWLDPMVCNNICLGTTADNGDSPDFGVDYGTQANVVSNYSSDDTATGVDYLRSQSAADTFVSIVAGSEDLHLKNGSNALRAGKDMGANAPSFYGRRMPYAPYDWDVDINGRDRDSEGDDWDIGAHQCEDCSEGGAVTNTAFMFFVD